jgi:hypothetical protein
MDLHRFRAFGSFPRYPTRTRWRTRGTASVEAVVALPVFVILFVGLLYVTHVAEAQQSVEMTARTCAWLYSAKNCNEIPPGCEGYLHAGTASAKEAAPVDTALQSHGSSGVVPGIVAGLLEPAIQAAFGRSLDASVPTTSDRPGLFGGGKVTVTGSYHLACNLTPMTLGDVAKDAWSRLWP